MSSAPPNRPRLQILWRALAIQLVHLSLAAGVILIALLGLTVAAAAFQARRDEARHVAALLVIAPQIPPQPLLDHTLELYRRGYTTLVLIAGPGQSQARERLIDRGVPAEAITLAPPAPHMSTWLAGAVDLADAETTLVVADPNEILNALKLAQDSGTRAYGSPPPEMPLSPLELLRSGVRYWGYVLGGSY